MGAWQYIGALLAFAAGFVALYFALREALPRHFMRAVTEAHIAEATKPMPRPTVLGIGPGPVAPGERRTFTLVPAVTTFISKLVNTGDGGLFVVGMSVGLRPQICPDALVLIETFSPEVYNNEVALDLLTPDRAFAIEVYNPTAEPKIFAMSLCGSIPPGIADIARTANEKKPKFTIVDEKSKKVAA